VPLEFQKRFFFGEGEQVMSYTEDSLTDGEEIVEIFKLHWIVTLMPLAILILSVGVLFPVSIYMWLRNRTKEYSVTTRRIIRKVGIISRNTDEMKLGAIETVEIRQGIFQRILGSGHVLITGRGSSAMGYDNVDEPMRVKKVIENAAHT
jgi:uncharacterized membrane protein YdbT with pleckstrin-like domain